MDPGSEFDSEFEIMLQVEYLSQCEIQSIKGIILRITNIQHIVDHKFFGDFCSEGCAWPSGFRHPTNGLLS